MHSYSFFFNDTATTEIYTLSLHDALPISGANVNNSWSIDSRSSILHPQSSFFVGGSSFTSILRNMTTVPGSCCCKRSEEHTSELQSHSDLVCRLLLEKKKKTK